MNPYVQSLQPNGVYSIPNYVPSAYGTPTPRPHVTTTLVPNGPSKPSPTEPSPPQNIMVAQTQNATGDQGRNMLVQMYQKLQNQGKAIESLMLTLKDLEPKVSALLEQNKPETKADEEEEEEEEEVAPKKKRKHKKHRHKKRKKESDDDEDDEEEEERKPKRKRKHRKHKHKKRKKDSDEEGELQRKNENTPPELMFMPSDVIMNILLYVNPTHVNACKVELVCKKMKEHVKAFWLRVGQLYYGVSISAAHPWKDKVTPYKDHIYCPDDKERKMFKGYGWKWETDEKKFASFVTKTRTNSTISKLKESGMNSLNVVPCVLLDPELGMVDSHVDRSRFSKNVLVGRVARDREEDAIDTTSPNPSVTVLYVLINRVKKKSAQFELKVVYADKKYCAPATKKIHRNDAFESVMRELEWARFTSRFAVPYWDPTDRGKGEAEHLKVNYPRHSVETFGSKYLAPYEYRPFSNCQEISQNANSSGYVIVTPKTFEDARPIVGDQKTDSILRKYFVPSVRMKAKNGKERNTMGNLWTDHHSWYAPATRYILALKCKVDEEDLRKPDLFLRACIDIDRVEKCPIPLSVEELTMDLQRIHDIASRR